MNLDSLLSQYESGSLSRRQLLTALAAIVAASPASAAQTAKPVGAVKSMNHVSIFVPNVQKSVEFYQAVFDMPLLTRQDPGINLSTGEGFLGIYPNQAGATGGSINHVCFGIENFDADATLK
ncbi:MAG: VOC family protein [Acidimicrobiia bacterium]